MRYSVIVLFLLLGLATGCRQEQTTTNELTADAETQAVVDNKVETETQNRTEETETQEVAAEVKGQGDLMSDEALTSELMELADKFFYNFYFKPEGDGTVTEKDRVLFAISYIAQYEYQELKKDTTNFMIHIPTSHVKNVVMRFFGIPVEDYSLEVPAGTEENQEEALPWSDIVFDGKEYVVPMQKSTWDTDCQLSLSSAERLDGNKIVIVFDVVKENEVLKQFEAVFEERDSLLALTKYKSLDVEGDASATEEQ